MKNRFLSYVLCFAVVLSLLPVLGIAASAVSAGQHIATDEYSSYGDFFYHQGIGNSYVSLNNATVKGTVTFSVTDGVFGSFSQAIDQSNEDYTYSYFNSIISWNANYSAENDVKEGINEAINKLNSTLRNQPADYATINRLLNSIPNDLSSGSVDKKDAYHRVIEIAKALVRNATGVYYVTWYDYDGTTVLQSRTEIAPGGTALYSGTTPAKPAGEDGTTYNFIGWGETLDATETVSTSVVNKDMDLYPIFQTVDPGDPIEDGGMRVQKSASIQDNGTVTINMEAFAHGRSGSALVAKDSEYVLLLDLNKLNNGGLAQFELWSQSDWPAAYFNPKSSDYKSLFYYIESEDRYALLSIYDCWKSEEQIRSDFAETEDQSDVWYHSDENSSSSGTINSYEFTLVYTDGNGKLHLLRDMNYYNVNERPNNKNEHHYKGVYFTKNNGWGGGSGEFYICYPSFDFYRINETKDTSTTRLEALKTSVKGFLENLKNNPQAKVQLVGYAGERVYSNQQFVIRNQVEDLTNGLKNVQTNYDTLISTVDNLRLLNSGTEPTRLYSFSSEALKYVNNNVTWETDSRTVVLFTSHLPSYFGSTTENEIAQASDKGANDAIAQARTLKTTNSANIYTIGLFADGYRFAPLSLYARNSNDPRYSDTYALDDYLQGVSSNYPNASNLANVKSSTASSDRYAYYAANAADLDDAFNYVIEETQESESTLDKSSLLKDYITQYFDTSNAQVTVQVADKMAGENNWSAPHAVPDPVEEEDDDVSYDLTGNAITVTGYDYAKHYVMDEDAVGQKLIVTVTGLIPTSFGSLPTNEGTSGIYEDAQTNEAVVYFRIPYVDTREDFFAVHEVRVKASDRSVEDGGTKLYRAQTKTGEPINFNIAEKAQEAGYLYGGTFDTFSEGQLSTPHAFDNGENGLSFTPVAGKEYFLKEVPKSYLKTKTLYRYSGVTLTDSYFITSVDSGDDYYQTGFMIDGTKTPVDEDNNVYRYVVLANGPIGGTGNVQVSVYVSDLTNDSKDVDSVLSKVPVDEQGTTRDFSKEDVAVTLKQAFEGASGYLALYPAEIKDAESTAQAYWITHDGVLVTGDNTRTVKNGRKYQTDGEDTAEISNFGTSSYQESLTVNSIFVGADDIDEEEIGQEGVKLAGYTTSLNGNIAMNFYMDLSDEVAADEDAYMQFTLPGTNHTEEVVSLKDARKQVRGDRTYYVFSAGVAAKDMTSDIKAQFVKGDGTKSEVWTYTIKQYCDYIRNHPEAYDETSVALVENMLNYGGYTQTYFKHNTDKLANDDLDLALPTVKLDDSFDPVITGEAEGLTYTGTSTMLTTTTGLRHYFEFNGNMEDYTFEANGKELEVQSDDNGSYVLLDSIKAKDLRKPITLTVTDKNGNTFKLSYSVYTNIKQVVGNDNFSAASQNLMKALYGYGEAAKAYFVAHA